MLYLHDIFKGQVLYPSGTDGSIIRYDAVNGTFSPAYPSLHFYG